MAWGKVDLCGLDTSKLPVLTPQRMQELYPLVHSGDKAARDEFIQGNLRLVRGRIHRSEKQRGHRAVSSTGRQRNLCCFTDDI